MHPTFGKRIGVNVALARAYPSSPAIAMVFHCGTLLAVVPLASSAAKTSEEEVVGIGIALGVGFGFGLALGLGSTADVAVALGVVAVAASGDVTGRA